MTVIGDSEISADLVATPNTGSYSEPVELTWHIWNLTSNDNISVAWPISIGNNDTWRTSVEQSPAAYALHVDEPLLKRNGIPSILKLFISRRR